MTKTGAYRTIGDMKAWEMFTERHEGVAFDRSRFTLIYISQPSRRARLMRSITGMILAMLSGFVIVTVFEEQWMSLIAVTVAVVAIFLLLHRTPSGRTTYTSWRYPANYNLFENETIRDRFATHPDEFTLIL